MAHRISISVLLAACVFWSPSVFAKTLKRSCAAHYVIKYSYSQFSNGSNSAWKEYFSTEIRGEGTSKGVIPSACRARKRACRRPTEKAQTSINYKKARNIVCNLVKGKNKYFKIDYVMVGPKLSTKITPFACRIRGHKKVKLTAAQSRWQRCGSVVTPPKFCNQPLLDRHYKTVKTATIDLKFNLRQKKVSRARSNLRKLNKAVDAVTKHLEKCMK